MKPCRKCRAPFIPTPAQLRHRQQKGKDGATNADLLGVGGFRYGARIFDLRRDGWLIETSAIEGGLYRFILKGRVQEQRSLFAEAR